MKVSDWKVMINKLNDDDELCIAKPSSDFGIIRIDYSDPKLFKKSEIDSSWKLQEINKFPEDDVDYVIY